MLSIITCAIESPEDNDIISDFFTKNKLLLYSEARKYLYVQEDIEDVVYEAFARIIHKMDVFRKLHPIQQQQYGKVIVRNLAYNLNKKNAHFSTIPFEEVDNYLLVAEEHLPDNVVIQKTQLQQVRQIWSLMPVEERLLLEQKYILKWSDEELAVQFGIQRQSVRMRLTRAKRRITSLMKEHGFLISEWLEK
jgi:RNA polymerase sigma-70 factor (ECF subfamily)